MFVRRRGRVIAERLTTSAFERRPDPWSKTVASAQPAQRFPEPAKASRSHRIECHLKLSARKVELRFTEILSSVCQIVE